MNPQIALLKASIDADVQEIQALYQQLAVYASPLESKEQEILAGYYLTYTTFNPAFENICLNVAKTFEGSPKLVRIFWWCGQCPHHKILT
ncbi:MAG: hypothetical protein HC881_07530 [Leptolyngbyaceae cyanobacterium SL_7_1]|nr:hypothetical protein [Leptolyngbyaceae cyanobacterium SL_7_1]